MKIAVLSRNPRLYSTRRLVEAGIERGHEMVVIDTLRAYMNIASHKPQIHYRGKPLEGFDAVIPRIGASVTFYGCAVLRQFEMMGVFPLNESVAIARSRDKLRSLQLLSRRGIGLPVTGFAHSPDDIPDLIQMVNGAPLVIKVLEGTQGIGVVLCETATAAESVIEAFGLFGDASELTTPGLVTTGSDCRLSPTPCGVKPTGLSPPSGPSGPNFWAGTGCSTPSLGSGSASTSSAIAQLDDDSPEARAEKLALPVVYIG